MGCDIHLYVEVRGPDKVWGSYEEWVDKYGEGRFDVPYEKQVYTGRSYDLFSILANVRNGYGFGGVDTGEGFVPISEPRGLPDDVSFEVQRCADDWEADGHSHSYLTVQELMEYDWTQVTTKRGIVSALEYVEWSRWRKGEGLGPESYSGGVFGKDIKHVSVEEMAKVVAEYRKKVPEAAEYMWLKALGEEDSFSFGRYHTQVSWDTPYYRSAAGFLGEVLPQLWRMGKFEDVRIVFWFDN